MRNGKGNLILGYNETPGSQTGSHNVVIGPGHSFSGHGGIVAGFDPRRGRLRGLAGHVTPATASYALAAGDRNVATGTSSTASAAYRGLRRVGVGHRGTGTSRAR